MPTRAGTIAGCCAVLLVVRVLAVGVALEGASAPGRRGMIPGDVRRYHQIAAGRGTPYADFAVEYPPLTLAAIDVLDRGTVRQSVVRVMWSQVALDALVALLLAWGWGRRTALVYLLLGLAFAWYPFLYLRLDLLSVALAVGGLALVRRRRPGTGGAMVALACFAKVWPLALVPAFAVRRKWRALLGFVAVGIVGAAAWIGGAGLDGPIQVLTFRGAAGWQIESTIGAVVHVFSHSGAHVERGAMRIGVVPDPLRVALPILGLLTAGAVWWLLRRVPRAAVHVVDGVAPLAAVAGMLACATLLSPQYVSWLLPFAAIAAAGGERTIGWLTAAVALLSTVGLQFLRDVDHGVPTAMAVVLVRNAMLIVLLGVAITRLVRLARPARPARVASVPAAVPEEARAGVTARPSSTSADLVGSAGGRPDDRRRGARA